MTYEQIRQFADSYGLGAMVLVYLVLVFWGCRPGSRGHYDVAANMIFADEGEPATHNGDHGHG